MRQLLDFARRDLHKRDALKAYQEGRVTLRELGHVLGLRTWATSDLLRAEGVKVARGARDETVEALDAVLADLGRPGGVSSTVSRA